MDSSSYNEGLDQAENKANSFGSKLKSGLGTAAKFGAAGIAALTGAAIGATTEIAKSVSETAEYGDNIDKMSQKMGLSAQAYQEWDAIMQHSGTSIESLQAGMKTLANAVENGNDAFGRLGITQEQIASMNQEELFSATISALQNVDNETERTYLAGQLLGRGATELGALLNTSAEDTEKMRQRVHELGGVMSDDAVKASAAFRDNLQDLQTSINGLKRGFTQALLPGFNDVIAGFTGLIIGEEGAEEQLTGGISNITETFSGMIPRIVEVVSGIGQAIITVAPQILSAGIEIVKSLAGGILDNSGLILDAVGKIVNVIVKAFSDHSTIARIGSFAADLLLTLSDGLAQNLPTILPAITEIIMDLVNVFTDGENLGNMVDAAIAILMALADGLVASVDVVIDKIPDILDNIIGAIIKNAPAMIQAMVDLFMKQIGMYLSVGSKLIGYLEQLVTAAGDWLGEKFSAIGDWLDEHLWTPIAEFFEKIWDGIKEFFEPIIQWFSDTWNAITEPIKEAFDKVMEIISPVLEALGELFSAFGDVATAVWELIKQAIGDAVDWINDKIQAMVDWWSENVSPVFEAVGDAISTAWENIKTAVGNAIDAIREKFSPLFDKLEETKGKFDDLKAKVKQVFEDIKSAIKEKIDDALHWGEDLMKNLAQGIANGIIWVTDKVKSVASTISSWLHQTTADVGPLKYTDQWTPDLMDNLIHGFDSKRGELERKVADIAKSMDMSGAINMTFSSANADTVTQTDSKIDAVLDAIHEVADALRNQTIEMDGEKVADLIDSRLGSKAALAARV